ncbi:MAG: hypothetical protein V2I67_00605, partial [Thermoanaerobaculales bacterium]|nr:hypothetical protein [Thermoanaerobaculales bacterium]
VIANILKEEPPQLSSSGAAVPVDLERAVHRCLEKRPEARFQSAADLAYSLKSVGHSGTAPVMATPGSGVETPAEKKFSLAQMGMTAALLILVAVTSWWALTRSETDEVSVEAVATYEPNRIAVVPFTNRTGDPTLDALGQRTADEIAGQLSSMEDLEVVPPSTVAAHIAERLTSSTMDPRTLVGEVAETTSAGLVFTGVVDTAGDSVELRCVLEDTVAGRVVQSFGPIVAQPNDLSPAMRTLVKEVFIATSDHLHPSLAFGAGEEWPDLETYRTFRERYRMIDRENFLPFLQLFQENPQLTRIRLNVAFSFLNGLAIRSAAEVLDSEHLEEAKLNRHQAAVTRALRLWTGGQYDVAYRLFRDELAESPGNTTLRHAAARCALFANRPATTAALYRDRVLDRAAPPGMVLLMVADAAAALHMLNDDEAAYEVLDRARVEIPSSLITDWCLLKQISLLGAMGETKRIEELLEEAIGRDFGRYEILMARINASHELRAHGYHDASVAMAEETLEFLAALCPGPPESCPVLSEFWLKALLIAGRDAEAAEMAGALEGKATGWIASRCLTGIAAARVGDTTTARNLFDRMEDLPAESDRYYNGTRAGDLKVSQAMIAAQLGDLDEALYLLRAGITGGALRVEHNLNFHELRHNVFFEPLWDHPEFQEIMRPKG